ncbi:MAG: indole-3-glycerol phosphate synthase TrpC [Myxococcaceae bacterium]|nr:indole-3-glycerol phosphate synthase TrpC [Myxococcaceae bacterium]
MSDVLRGILSRKVEEVASARRARPVEALRSSPLYAAPRRSLVGALAGRGQPSQIIAEVKRASPSAGAIRPGLDAVAQATEYASAGAAAVSVLTDGPGFGGSLRDLEQVRARVGVPVLRKDFIVDAYQLEEAKASGADAVLLIVAALEAPVLAALHQQAVALGLDVLVEVHDEAELDVALGIGPALVGVNNRNLSTFHVSLEVSERLLPRLPTGVKGVAESGVTGPADVTRLRRCGAANFLVGEALVRAPSASTLLAALKDA